MAQCLHCFLIFFCVCLCTVVLLTQAGILSPNKTDYHYGNSIKKKFNSMISWLKTRLSTFYQLFSNGRMKISPCYCQHRLKCTIIFKSLSAGEKLHVNTKNTLSAIWWIQLSTYRFAVELKKTYWPSFSAPGINSSVVVWCTRVFPS